MASDGSKLEEIKDRTRRQTIQIPRHSWKQEDIVISGMAGKFPESDNVYQFRDNLFNKANLISDGNYRWKSMSNSHLSQKAGRLKDISAFDAGFFGIRRRLANHMDVFLKMSFESAYETILDAGYHPSELAGTNTGVFIGATLSDTENYVLYDTQVENSHSMIGATRSMIAHQLSYFFRLQGPSYTIDCGCGSSMYALEHAYRSIRQGICQMAIVGGANLFLHPNVILHFIRLGVISKDGCCKSFDDSADGYVRSETISTLFLEKSKDARRIYAHFVHSKLNCDGYKQLDIAHPSSRMQTILMEEVYNECNVDLSDVSFLEAHGSGTRVGDLEELKAISNVFCRQREKQLYIGAVKSNAGHSEPAAAIMSVIKVLIGMECGFIPPNMNFRKPREDIEALVKGQLKVVTEKTPWPDNKGIVGVHSIGLGGANGHIVLRWNQKLKNADLVDDDLPRLVCASGRTKHALDVIWDDLSGRYLDEEFVDLLHTVFGRSTIDHPFRGFQILTKFGELKRSWSEVAGGKTKLVWVFSNYESNWPKVGKQLMAFPVFVETLETVRNKIIYVLNLDVLKVLRTYVGEIEANQILATMTVQICLAAVLKRAGIIPDVTIGLGNGKLIAAYFEGSVSLDEVIGKYFPLGFNSKSERFKINSPEPSTMDAIRELSSGGYEILVIGAEIESFEHLSLVREDSQDYVLDVLTAFGRLYENGHQLHLNSLYPRITWPVGRGTPMISPLIKWNHNQNWNVAFQVQTSRRQRVVHIDVKNKDWNFLTGHIINERNIFPPFAYLSFVWETLAEMKGRPLVKTKVIFEDVTFARVIDLTSQDDVKLVISIVEANETFEITEGDVEVMTGRVYEVQDDQQEEIASFPEPTIDEEILTFSREEIYRELRLRGYHYRGEFKSIESTADEKKGLIKWTGNWVTCMDCLFQMLILHVDNRNLYLPSSIKQLIIDPVKHLGEVLGESKELSADVNYHLGIIRAGGIEFRGLQVNPIPRQETKAPLLEAHKFIPNITALSLGESVRALVQIITENNRMDKFRSVELPGGSQLISPHIRGAVDDLPLIQAEVIVFSKQSFRELPGVRFEDGGVLREEENLLLVVLTRAFEKIEVLCDALEAVKGIDGYILSREGVGFDVSDEALHGLDIVCAHTTDLEKLVLLRKKSEGHERRTVINVSNDLDWLSTAQGAIKGGQPVIFYSQNNCTNGILGLVSCLRKERNGGGVSCFFMMDVAPEFDPEHPFYERQVRKNMAFNVWKDGKWGTYRHLLLKQNALALCATCRADVTVPGELASVKFVQGKQEIDDGLQMIYVYWSALNVRDVLIAIGGMRLGADGESKRLGVEFSGRDIAGKRVMGLTTKGALATHVSTDSSMIWTVPNEWSLEDAATVPGVYLTVMYALLMKGNIKRGKTILVHVGDGCIGQAAINVALHFGCAVFVSVDTLEEMIFFRSKYPEIEENRIGYSRTASFDEMVLLRTGGRGVDIVLNSVTTVNCIARQGKFILIGINDEPELKTELFGNGVSLHIINLDSLISMQNAEMERQLSQYFVDLLGQGAIKPIFRTVFGMEEVACAFESMASGKRIGKVLVNIRKEGEGLMRPNGGELFNGLARFRCDPKGTYVIIGGLGGFGLQLANWLVTRGATKLILNSRTRLKTGYQAMMLRLWQSRNAQISLRTDDVTTEEGCVELITHANSLGPVEAIFNLAIVLRDALFEDQTVESFEASLAPKAVATQNLDTVSRMMCPRLRHFVVFSSGSCGKGNAMQSNYGMANSVMERICEKRKAEGFPALAVQWGPIGDVGVMAIIQENADKEIIIGGTSPQGISSCLRVLDTCLRQDEIVIVGSIIVAEKDTAFGKDIVNNFLNILGIRDLTKINPHLSLAEVGLNSILNAEIKQVLEKEYQMFLSSEEISTMTVANLQELAEVKAKNINDSNH